MQISDLLNMYNSSQNSQTSQTDAVGGIGQSVRRSLNLLQMLPVGSVFEGSVNDIKDNVVTLGLSNGKSIHARLENGVTLMKGDSVFFEVKSNSGGSIALKPYEGNITGNPILENALNTAGLSVNSKNLTMVNSMMQESMAVDAKSLLEMAKTVSDIPDTQVASAVQMQKLGIPVNPANVNQYVNYAADKSQITSQLNELMENLPEALGSDQISDKELLGIANDILETFLPSEEEAGSQTVQTTQVAETAAQSEMTIQAENAETAKGAETSPQAEATIQSEMATQTETAEMAKTAETTAQAETAETVKPAEIATQAETTIQSETSAQTESAESVIVTETMESVEDAEMTGLPENKKLGQQVLNETEINNLASNLAETTGEPVEQLKDKISGMNSEQLLREVKTALENKDSSPEHLRKLLSGNEFKKLFSDAVNKSWTLKPDEVKDKAKVEDLYQRLDQELEKLDKALKVDNPLVQELSQTVQETRENIQFMNDVNQAYTFVQIPLKMSGQNVNSELYVMTNRKNLNDPDKEVTAYLHLDMEHLGSTDVFIKMLKKNVTANFALEDDKSYELVEKNLPKLEEKLNQLGYTAKMNIKNENHDIDFVEDFLRADDSAQNKRVYRYSFDARA